MNNNVRGHCGPVSWSKILSRVEWEAMLLPCIFGSASGYTDVIHSLFRLGPDDIHSRNGPYAWHTTPCVTFHYKLTFNWPVDKPTQQQQQQQ